MPLKSKIILAIFAIVLLGATAASYFIIVSRDGGANAVAFIDPDNAGMVGRGETVYGQNCADCHGKNLEGQPDWRVKTADGIFPAPPHDATGHTWHHADQVLFNITKRGGQAGAPTGFISGMPGFAESLPDGDILAVLAYIKSRWPQEIRTRHTAMSRKAAAQ